MAITYGYVRVSAADQNEARQIDAMAHAGVERTNVVIEKQSGKDFNRPGWRRLRRIIKNGDLLVVQSIDRLGRNYAEILDEWRHIVKGKGADIRVLDTPLLDTTKQANGLVGRFVADIVLQILSFVADRKQKHQRTTTTRNCLGKTTWSQIWSSSTSVAGKLFILRGPGPFSKDFGRPGRHSLRHEKDLVLACNHIRPEVR